jgi:hypothetical protein
MMADISTPARAVRKRWIVYYLAIVAAMMCLILILKNDAGRDDARLDAGLLLGAMR